MNRGKQKRIKPLSSRRFAILWHLYRMKESVFNLVDFVIPHHYPRSIQTPSYELIRILTCITNLAMMGIKLERSSIQDFTLSIIDKNKQVIINQQIQLEELCPNFIDIVIRELSKHQSQHLKNTPLQSMLAKKYPPALINAILSGILAEILKKLLNTFQGLGKDGDGIFQPGEDDYSIDTGLFTRVTPLLQLEFDINRRQLNTRFRNYLRAFDQGKLLQRKGYDSFAPETTHKIFSCFIRELLCVQKSTRLTFELAEGSQSSGSLEDAFTKVFKDQFPKEYKLWQSGLFYFPFFEELALAEFQGKLKVEDIVIATHGNGFFHRLLKGAQLSRRKNFNKVKLKAYLHLQIQPEFYQSNIRSMHIDGDTITLIEVVRSDRPRFKVYLNRNYKEPVFLTKSNKAGEILYGVAAGDEVDYRYFRKNMEYINHDSNFKLYSQSEYRPSLLLAKVFDDDGEPFIGAAEGVSIEMIEE